MLNTFASYELNCKYAVGRIPDRQFNANWNQIDVAELSDTSYSLNLLGYFLRESLVNLPRNEFSIQMRLECESCDNVKVELMTK